MDQQRFDIPEVPEAMERHLEVSIETATAELRCSACGLTLAVGERFARVLRRVFHVACHVSRGPR